MLISNPRVPGKEVMCSDKIKNRLGVCLAASVDVSYCFRPDKTAYRLYPAYRVNQAVQRFLGFLHGPGLNLTIDTNLFDRGYNPVS